ncbi:MAG: hypothetical protein HYZ52_05240 [Candidatus Omnitrophica bacterium]|nr:hypothetical protein [Candidatus Omnitrophota bacterium]
MFFLGASFWLCGCAAFFHSEEIDTLIDAGKDQNYKEAVLAGEEAAFQNVKEAAKKGILAPPLSGEEIRKQFGEPVVILTAGAEKKWAYKSRRATWFSGPKIYLFFDKEEHLTRLEEVVK